MAEYAVGDVQGCMDALQCVLDRVSFNPEKDRLWLTGDLVNRGAQSLEVLRFVKSLGEAAVVILGNHDLHLLAVAFNKLKPKRKDTLQPILDAPDCDELLHWLRNQPLVHFDAQRNLLMVHAGIPHNWTQEQTMRRASLVEGAIRGKHYRKFFAKMYGNSPTRLRPDLKGEEKLRVITNYLTRMRFIDARGNLELESKSVPESAPKGFSPWFAFPRDDNLRIIFGHWAALLGKTGHDNFIGLDTGCIWGGELTLMNIDTGDKISCSCASSKPRPLDPLDQGALP